MSGSNAIDNLNPRSIIADSDDEARLIEHVRAYIRGRTGVHTHVSAVISDLVRAQPNPDSACAPNLSPHVSSTAPTGQSGSTPGSASFHRFDFSSPAASQSQNLEQCTTKQATAAMNDPGALSDTTTRNSPQLAHRAWAALANMAHSIAPLRARSAPSNAPSTQPGSPLLSEVPRAQFSDAMEDATTTAGGLSHLECQTPQEGSARSSSAGETYSEPTVLNADLWEQLDKELGQLLGNANDDMEDGQLVESTVSKTQPDIAGSSATQCQSPTRDGGAQGSNSVFTEFSENRGKESNQATQREDSTPQSVGLSRPSFSILGKSSARPEEMAEMHQPLVLPGNSGGLSVPSSSPDGPSEDSNANTAHDAAKRATRAIPMASQPACMEYVDDDVQMMDVEPFAPEKNDVATPSLFQACEPAAIPPEVRDENTGAGNSQVDTRQLVVTGQSDAAPAIDAAAAGSHLSRSNSDTQGEQPEGAPCELSYTATSKCGTQPVGQDRQASTNTDSANHQGSDPTVLPSPTCLPPLGPGRSTPQPAPGDDEDDMTIIGTMVHADRADSTRTAPSKFGASTVGQRASPTPSTRSPYTPSTDRFAQLFDYLMQLVSHDKLKDDLQCQHLVEKRTQHAGRFEQAKRKYQHELAANNIKMELARASQQLKKDTLRLLRSQYRNQVSDARFRTRLGIESRVGSDRRGQGREGNLAGGQGSTVVGSRRATPVPPSRVKRERLVKSHIDLTGDGAVNDPGMRARSRRTPSVAGTLYAGSLQRAPSGASSLKVGKVTDLLQNPRIKAKCTTSRQTNDDSPAIPATGAVSRGASATPTLQYRAVRCAETSNERGTSPASQAVKQWLSDVNLLGPSNRSRATTPGSKLARRQDARSLLRSVEGRTRAKPIVVGDEDGAHDNVHCEKESARSLCGRAVSARQEEVLSLRASSVNSLFTSLYDQ